MKEGQRERGIKTEEDLVSLSGRKKGRVKREKIRKKQRRENKIVFL